ncbi:Transcriptional regulator, TetR family [Sulfitobacter noctilucicola]|uniref:Pimeloyl-ACP methyl ester carboxylesterase/AcrR family transcriptional regulator n=1 Tax=Sulfitobacter noctilucicola TaxID=1342301 RepID=A0A7W6MA15_9RHOB|nr:alpha/beta fold hydrolase [Sulfitobacter noctilucicola]KIN63483.1 Transcriptional regulator, TetR family [Sulfitobacter noctilucicola]MBB4175006.1 pimeloyl-ACP methyl ester carboxylesterase/AcrR family transcriptional regulator [Sulfitobacter noctilucicola]
MPVKTVHCIGTSDRSADEIWAVAAEFAAPWHPMIDWMALEPASGGRIIRRFAAKGDDQVVREQLTYLSHSDRIFAYTALEGITGADRYDAWLQISDDGTGSRLNWSADIDAEATRARQIAQGTEAVFKAGIEALASGPLKRSKNRSLPDPVKTTTTQIAGSPSLAVTTLRRKYPDSKVLCLFLHGIGGNRSNWDTQVSALGSMMPMASLDLRGYGDSELGAAQSTLQDYFDDIDRVMDHFGAEKLVLCGLSYGAWIAASYALQKPERMAGLVLCGGCTGMSEASTEARDAFRNARQVPLDAGQTPADFADAVLAVIAGPDATTEVRATLHASMAAIPSATYRDALTCFTNPPAALAFDSADFPVLMMTGEHDRLAPPTEIREVSKRFAASAAPFVQFEVVAGAGHVCNLEAPAQVNRHLHKFLSLFAEPPAPSAKQARQAAKRARILDAALREFSLNGYSGTSMQAIAERAEVSKPTLYQYIGQKDAILRAVLETGRETILAPFTEAQTHTMARVLWQFSWAYARHVLRPDHLAVARLMIGEAERVPEVVKQFNDTGPARTLSGIAAYLTDRRDAGHLIFDDAYVAAEHLWSLILSGPRNHALYFPQDVADDDTLHRSITNGLRVFLRAYAKDVEGELATLDKISEDGPL